MDIWLQKVLLTKYNMERLESTKGVMEGTLYRV
jgi:hypothetical protein